MLTLDQVRIQDFCRRGRGEVTDPFRRYCTTKSRKQLKFGPGNWGLGVGWPRHPLDHGQHSLALLNSHNLVATIVFPVIVFIEAIN